MKLLAQASQQIRLPGNLGNIIFPPTRINQPIDLAVNIINWSLEIGGALAVIAIVYSGIMYLTAGANQEQAEKAKKNLSWAVIGLVLMFLAILIVNVVINMTQGNPI